MATEAPLRLTVETAIYETHKAEWLSKYRDQFVVIKNQQVLGFFPEFREAYYAGVEEYGITTDFLVKRVVPQEPIFVVF